MALLPHSNDIENAVIWAILIDTEQEFFPEWVVPEDFYDPINAILWDTILQLKKKWEPIDVLSVSREIQSWPRKELYERWDLSNEILCDKMTAVFTSANLPYYVKQLKELRRSREVIRIWDTLLAWENDKWKILQLSDKLSSIASIWEKWSDWSVEYDDVNSAYELMLERMGKKVWGYSWWRQFQFLDEYTRGIMKKQVVRIGAPSGVWKTQFVYNVIPELMLQNNPDWTPVKVLFFTLENAKEMTLTSLLCKAKGYDYQELSEWRIEWDWQYLVDLKDRLYIVDDLYDLDDIFAKIKEVKPDVVILDYIGYIQVRWFPDEGRYKEYAKRVVPFAKKNDVAWIDLSNLANETQTNDEIRFKPKFYGASELVNNSDVNIFIMRNEEFKKTKDKVMRERFSYKPEDIAFFRKRNMLDMILTKNRWGSPWFETTYWVNQENGWIYKEVTKEDMDKLWAKFW